MEMRRAEKEEYLGGGEMIGQRKWYPDHRDGFIMWLKGEFAAANAIIDSLSHHLRVVGEPGEYERVISTIDDRRCNWNPVLHSQPYFSIIEVLNALHQVASRRQHRRTGKEFRGNGGGSRQGQRGDFAKGNSEKKGERVVENGLVILNDQALPVVADKRVGQCDVPLGNHLNSIQISSSKENGMIIPETFVANETLDGKEVNVVDGMKLYDALLDISEITKILTLVNDMRAAGKRGELQGHTFVLFKRSMYGHERERIQFGLPNALPEGENDTGVIKDPNILPILQLLQDVVDRLVSTQILSVKPDSCIIDVFYEGDHSQPRMWPSHYERPVSVLFLTDCEMTFGKFTGLEYTGECKGSLELSLQPGSLLVMEGNSVNLTKYALSSFKKQRILVTLTKLQSSKPAPTPTVAPVPHWGSQPSQSPNNGRHPMSKHYGPLVPNGIIPSQPFVPQLGPSNVMRPIFMPPPVVAPAMHFPAPVALPPRAPLPGTGVFLPPGSSHSSPPSITVTEASFSPVTVKENGSHTECNGSLNGGTVGAKFETKEELQKDAEPQAGNQASRDT